MASGRTIPGSRRKKRPAPKGARASDAKKPKPTATSALPRPFAEWRIDPIDREEDAAYAFGYHLIVHCRDEALKQVSPRASARTRASIEEAVDTALHNVLDMLEGFWSLELDPKHTIDLALKVQVRDDNHVLVESHEISPCKLDLPIGYWKWARDREFR